jgi:hypothetical protein
MTTALRVVGLCLPFSNVPGGNSNPVSLLARFALLLDQHLSFLAKPRQEGADTMGLPCGCRHQLRQRCALGSLEHFADDRRFASGVYGLWCRSQRRNVILGLVVHEVVPCFGNTHHARSQHREPRRSHRSGPLRPTRCATHANSNARFDTQVEWKVRKRRSCVWTCAASHCFVSTMDDEDIALIRQLCTRVGCLMEDTSVVALIWDDGVAIDARLAKLSAAANDIHALVAAAQALHKC